MSIIGGLIFTVLWTASIYPLARLFVWFEGPHGHHEGTQS